MSSPSPHPPPPTTHHPPPTTESLLADNENTNSQHWKLANPSSHFTPSRPSLKLSCETQGTKINSNKQRSYAGVQKPWNIKFAHTITASPSVLTNFQCFNHFSLTKTWSHDTYELFHVTVGEQITLVLMPYVSLVKTNLPEFVSKMFNWNTQINE